MAEKRLVRSRQDKKLAGVCGGIATYTGLDPTLVRILVVVAAVITFPIGVFAYLIIWLAMPREPLGGSPYDQPPGYGGPGAA